jgi:hypothetical protein
MKLTVSMAAYNDYDGVFFTVQSLRLHQRIYNYDHEILVLDNNPESEHGAAIKRLAQNVKEMRVIDMTAKKSSFVKYEAFTHASGDVVLGLDCHVLLEPGFIAEMMKFWEQNPDSKDLLTGPLIYDDLKHCSTHQDANWRDTDLGKWGDDQEGMATNEPFEIPMQGMACFSAMRSTFPILNRGFVGFGAEEWYVAEKIRRNGGRVLCHPRMGWLHRFDWPKREFPLTMDDRIFNYYLGWLELYGTEKHPMIQQMHEHWAKSPYAEAAKAAFQRAKAQAAS